MKPITRIIIALFIAGIFCQVTFMQSRKWLLKYNVHKTERLSELFLKSTAHDILFIGSSRTHTSINPFIIDSVCKSDSYNAGSEGSNLYEFKMVLDGYLVNHPPPKILVLTLDLHSFDITRKFHNYTQYLPFVENHVLLEKLKQNGKYNLFNRILPFLELTDYDDYTRANVIRGFRNTTEIPPGEIQYKGYLSNGWENISGKPPEETVSWSVKIAKEGILLLKDMLDTCRRNSIRVIFTYAPEYKQNYQKNIMNKDEVFSLINQIAKANSIPFLRHDKLEMCNNPVYFSNTPHVNRPGADLYSVLLGRDINRIINSGRD